MLSTEFETGMGLSLRLSSSLSLSLSRSLGLSKFGSVASAVRPLQYHFFIRGCCIKGFGTLVPFTVRAQRFRHTRTHRVRYCDKNDAEPIMFVNGFVWLNMPIFVPTLLCADADRSR